MREALAERLFSLFTGYHASRQLVMQVYEVAGFNLAGMAESVLAWSEYELHLMVACFLRARFPIVVALNKADMPEAKARVDIVKAELGSACMPVSARSEWWLWDQQRKGHLTFQAGGGAASVALAASAPAFVAEQWKGVRAVLEQYGSTGAQEVVSAAVQKRRPLFMCPVADFDTFEPLQHAAPSTEGSKGGGKFAPLSRAPLAVMVILRPLSTVEEAFNALKHEQMLRGDFVRAELLTEVAKKTVRVLKREETFAPGLGRGGAIVLRVLTNKKAK